MILSRGPLFSDCICLTLTANENSYASVDVAPTILKLMGVEHNISFPGVDGSTELFNDSMDTDDENQMVFMTSRALKQDMLWAAAVTSRYKLVLSINDVPWLFDRVNDPSELINYHNHTTSYSDVIDSMQQKLLTAMAAYDFPLAKKPFLLRMPDCRDSPDAFYKGSKQKRQDCERIKFPKRKENWCRNENINSTCPIKCERCNDDSPGTLWINETVGKQNCSFMVDNTEYCDFYSANAFCLETCQSTEGGSIQKLFI
jgi:hypothetical protein